MRLFVFNCLLLASVAVASPNDRHKRDLAYLKNLMASAIFGRSQINIQPEPVFKEENGYKLFPLPGYDDVMIRVALTKPVVEEFVYPPAMEKVNLNAFGTVVGTKSKDDTLVAVKEVNNLLSTGILYGGQNNVMKETVVPMFPSLSTSNYVVGEKGETATVIKTRPVLTEVVETRPVLAEGVETRSVLTEEVETRPVVTEVIRPVEDNELIVPFEPTYSYKEIQNNEPVMTYTTHNNPGVELVETIKTKTELPMRIKKRVNEAIVLGADPNWFAPLQEVYQYQSPPVVDFSYPRVQANAYVQNSFLEEVPPSQKVYQYQSPSFVDLSYPRVEANAYVQNSFSDEFPSLQKVYQYQSPSFVGLSYPRVESNAYVQNSFREEVPSLQKVYQYQSPSFVDLSYPRVESNAYVQNSFREEVPSLQKVYQYQSPSFVDLSYPRVEAKSHVQNSFREELTKESDVTNGFGLTSQRLKPLKDSPVRYNLRPTKTNAINPRPNPLHSHKSRHFEGGISASKDKVNPPTTKVQAFNNFDEKDDIPQTLGQYIARVNNKGRYSIGPNGNMKQIKAVPIVGSKDHVSNANIPINVYKLQRNPNTGKVVKGNDALPTNVKTNANQYVNGSAVNSGTAEKDTAQVKNVVYSNMVTEKSQSVTSPVVVASTNAPKQPLRENIQTSNENKPTVVKNDQNDSYPQKEADGSSLNENGNKHGVSVSVKENNNKERGDIPDFQINDVNE